MCEGCWDEAGRPLIANAGVDRGVKALAALYVDHAVGGALHIVTDDWNIEDSHLDYCAQWLASAEYDEYARETREKYGWDCDGSRCAVELECLAAFRAMSMDERHSAMAHQWRLVR